MKENGKVKLTHYDWQNIERAIKYVDEYYQRPLTAQDLCERFSLGRAKFYKGFRAKTGLPLHKYHTQIRIEKVKYMLYAEPRTTLNEIADQVGYKSASQLCQIFKAFCGYTAANYKSMTLDTIVRKGD